MQPKLLGWTNMPALAHGITIAETGEERVRGFMAEQRELLSRPDEFGLPLLEKKSR